MIEVTMFMEDAQEVNLLAQFQYVLEQQRLAKRTKEEHEMYGTTPPNAEQVVTQPTPTIEQSNAAVERGLDKVATFEVVDDVSLMRAVTEFAGRHGADGIPKTRAKLEEFGVTKAMEIPAERRAEFVRALS